MKHFINLKDIPAKDLRKIIIDAKKRKISRKKLSNLEVDKGAPLKGKLLTIRAAENVVRILPPLNVKKTEINQALKIIDNVCSKMR